MYSLMVDSMSTANHHLDSLERNFRTHTHTQPHTHTTTHTHTHSYTHIFSHTHHDTSSRAHHHTRVHHHTLFSMQWPKSKVDNILKDIPPKPRLGLQRAVSCILFGSLSSLSFRLLSLIPFSGQAAKDPFQRCDLTAFVDFSNSSACSAYCALAAA